MLHRGRELCKIEAGYWAVPSYRPFSELGYVVYNWGSCPMLAAMPKTKKTAKSTPKKRFTAMPLYYTDQTANGVYDFCSARRLPVDSNRGFLLSTGADFFVGLPNKPDGDSEGFRYLFPRVGHSGLQIEYRYEDVPCYTR